jgi:hypothetical protein
MISPKGYTIVDGDTLTGLYAADGTTNVVDSSVAVDDNEDPIFVGLYHPCGAYWVTFTEDTNHPVYAPNGSLYVYAEAEED